jgi:hypothetical protein
MRDGTGLAKACDFSPERRRKWACGCVSTGRIASALVTSTSDDGKQARNGIALMLLTRPARSRSIQ